MEYALIQVLVQFVNAVGGLLVTRTLPKSEYALLAVVSSMQSACQALTELGTGMGLRARGGRIWDQPTRFGQLLRTSLCLKRQFGVVAFSICLPITGWLLWRNGASSSTIGLLGIVFVTALVPLLGTSTWLVRAQLHGEYRRIQRLELGSAGFRLSLIGALSFGHLNAFLAAGAGAAGNWVQALTLRKWANSKTNVTRVINSEDRRELLRLSLRSLPNAVFFCIQGQVLILIVTITGSPAAVAELAALTRLATVFAIFSVAFNNIVVPKFVRCQEPDRLRRTYVDVIGGMILALGALAGLAWLWPKPLLWLLGGKYAHLQRECGWIVTSGCVGQLGMLMWNLNSSKAWIRVQAPGFIPTVLLVQVIAALALDLRRFNDLLLFNLLTVAAPIPIYIVDAVLGLRTNRFSSDSNFIPAERAN